MKRWVAFQTLQCATCTPIPGDPNWSQTGNEEILLPATTLEQDEPPEGGLGKLNCIITWIREGIKYIKMWIGIIFRAYNGWLFFFCFVLSCNEYGFILLPGKMIKNQRNNHTIGKQQWWWNGRLWPAWTPAGVWSTDAPLALVLLPGSGTGRSEPVPGGYQCS